MRVFNRLAALILGIALSACGVVVVIEAIATWTNSGFVLIPGRRWLTSFKTTPWSATIVVAVSIAVAAAGFALVVAEVRPQRKRHAVFSTAGDWLLLRRSTEAYLQRRLAAEVPVSPIKVRLKPRALRWRLKVKARGGSSTPSPTSTTPWSVYSAATQLLNCGPCFRRQYRPRRAPRPSR